MDPDPPSPSPRKLRFAPKGPPRRTPRFTTPEIEEDGGEDNELKQSLARRVSEHLARRGRRVEKKSSVRVAFQNGAASTSIRSFGKQREMTDDGSKRTHDGSIVAYSEASAAGEMQNLVTSISAAESQVVDDNSVDLTDAAIVKKKKEYREPWDYHHSYYPITLPIRRPYSGDPEVLDKAEFEEALKYDENSLASASNLGLLEQDDTPRMLVFMFPSNLPLGGQSTNAHRRGTNGNSNGIKGKEIVGSSSGYPLKKDDSLEELPEGYMGKMLVYKSGAVKLKLGDIMYDVSPGADCCFPQKVMAINATDKHCCDLGEGNKRAFVTPDIDSLLLNEDPSS
ncbi:hypothetical protein C2S52_013393 [Perilla frutescens var. hirtella]|nr:hypothetical protein C2S51_015693 [Perilla frutescens var. frutescens]KAH6775832.1 hypothetical protein C2S52_013393 [Perilla frutescens var. hirtella]